MKCKDGCKDMKGYEYRGLYGKSVALICFECDHRMYGTSTSQTEEERKEAKKLPTFTEVCADLGILSPTEYTAKIAEEIKASKPA